MLGCEDGVVRFESLPCMTPDHFGGVVTQKFHFGLVRPDDLPPVCLRVVQMVFGKLEVLPEASLALQEDLPGVL